MASALDSGSCGLGMSPSWVGGRVCGHAQCLSSHWCTGTGKFNAGSNLVMDCHPIQEGS